MLVGQAVAQAERRDVSVEDDQVHAMFARREA
jgi:hypothetical protein